MVDRSNGLVDHYDVSKQFYKELTTFKFNTSAVFPIYCYYNYTANLADDKRLIYGNLVDQ